MKIIKLLRVSSRKQLKGNSLQDQEESLEKYAISLGASVVKTIKIQVSGSKMLMNQGVLMKALEEARSSDASLMVSALDRLSRDATTLHLLRRHAQDKGVEVYIAGMNRTLSSMNEIEFGVLSSFCAYELSRIKTRVANSTRRKPKEFAFGKVNPKQTSKVSAEKRRRLANEWRNQIDLVGEIKNAISLLKAPTLDRIAQMLNGKGLVTIRGNKWSKAHVHLQLKAMGFNKWQELAI